MAKAAAKRKTCVILTDVQIYEVTRAGKAVGVSFAEMMRRLLDDAGVRARMAELAQQTTESV